MDSNSETGNGTHTTAITPFDAPKDFSTTSPEPILAIPTKRTKSVSDHSDRAKLTILRKEYKKLSQTHDKTVAEHNSLLEKLKEKGISLDGLVGDTSQKHEAISLIEVDNKQLSEENLALRNDLDTMRNRVAECDDQFERNQKRISILLKDRRILEEEIQRLKVDVVELTDDVNSRDESLEALARKMEEVTLRAYSQTHDASNARPIEKEDEDAEFRHTFHLPDSEFQINKYSCLNNHLVPGAVHLTPLYLCFDSLISPGGSSQRVISIEDIDRVEKVRLVKLPFLKADGGHTLGIYLKDGEVVSYHGFTHRDSVYANIQDRIFKIHNS